MSQTYSNEKFVKIWLFASIILVYLMILVGGITRLTDSGLSITQWELFSGILPPITELEWDNYFEKYKLIPQYQLLNSNMTIDEFKIIFLWEYFHRLMARLTGIVFLIPLIFFTLKKYIDKKYINNFIIIFLLICFQGFIGWYMVSSGLSENTSVSHYRLAMHLSIAFIIFALLLWNYFLITNKLFLNEKLFDNFSIKFLVILFLIQIIFGAFTSGLDAGRVYQTWPLMNESFFPDDVILANVFSFFNFDNISIVQFYHRIIAYIFLFYFLFIWFKIKKFENFQVSKIYFYGLFFLFLQIILGIVTLTSNLNFYLALIHQTNSVILFVLILYLNFITQKYRIKTDY